MNTLQRLASTTLFGLTLLTGACGHDTSVPGPGTPPPPNKCGSCTTYELCLTDGTCGINPSSTWFLAVDSAVIASTKSTGATWDALGGAPDPFVILDTRQTTTKQDTFTPSWQEGATFTAATLTGTGVSIAVYDEDVASNDLIGGPSTLRLTESDLRRGSLTISKLGQVDSISFLVSPR